MKYRKYVLLLLAFAVVIWMAGCSGADTGKTDMPNSDNESIDSSSTDDPAQPLSPEDKKAKEDFASSTPENDTDVGLKSIKIDTAEMTLTDEQKAVLNYFDDDYLNVPSYEFLRRYPQVFDGAQLTVWGSVIKVISMDANSYELVLWLDVGPVEWEYAYEYPEYNGCYVLISGETGDTWFMEGDTLQVYGRYAGIENTVIDGTSFSIPKISAYSALFDTSAAPNDIYRYIEKFNMDDVKTVAKAVFGSDIEVRRPIVGTDVPDWQSALWYEVCEGDPCYVVELENQSNAKFTKYFFFTDSNISAYGGARIADAKDSMGDTSIRRNLEFSADFAHFFLFTYDEELEDLKLEYYDHDLNKLWEREFSETTTALYDYTKNNIYLVANNELYIINIETGEDTFTPSYVGPKVAMRKLRDGILMISESKSDGVMKAALDGSITWKTNLPADVHFAEGLQIIDSKIVFEQYSGSPEEGYGTRYVVLDNESGDIIVDAVSIG